MFSDNRQPVAQPSISLWGSGGTSQGKILMYSFPTSSSCKTKRHQQTRKNWQSSISKKQLAVSPSKSKNREPRITEMPYFSFGGIIFHLWNKNSWLKYFISNVEQQQINLLCFDFFQNSCISWKKLKAKVLTIVYKKKRSVQLHNPSTTPK